MSISGSRQFQSLARRKPPHRIIIARGENVRTFTLRPWLAGTLALVAVLLGVLYLAATGYLVFRDDLLTASIALPGRMQHAYEDRIATLRSDIDRLTSRQLVNQEAFDAKMDRLLGRQAALDARQDIIAGLSQAARRAGIAGPDAGGLAEAAAVADAPAAEAAGNPPAEDAVPGGAGVVKIDPLKTSSAGPAAGAMAPIAIAMLRTATGKDPLAASAETAKIGAVETSLDALARDQVDYVGIVASKVSARTEKIATILKKLGQPVPAAADSEDGVGGPFIPLDDNADPETFRSSVALVTDEIDRFTTIRRLAGELPLAKPVADAAITSRFGARLDPFVGRPATHPGIDFRAEMGYPVKATAAGQVVTAELAGSYGNMIEIDHGNGVTTRYGHLSRILVKVGELVAKGAIIGRTGNTGRSTGPHLHYEVRVDGNAIDPMRYMRAGSELGTLL
jgi:murein DD-endopeptidase MepM/ murein hydrolase activator NlpD